MDKEQTGDKDNTRQMQRPESNTINANPTLMMDNSREEIKL